MRPKSAVLLVLALGCGLVAALGINQVMTNKSDATVVAAGETTPIFVALERIGIGDVIKAEQVKLVDWDVNKVPEGAVTKLEELEDRRPWTPLFPGDPIVEAKLFGKGETGGGIETQIDAGMRVVAVRVNDEQGGAGLVKPGDRVDLSVHVRANPSEGIDRSATYTFLQNVKVAAVNAEWRPDKEGKQSIVAKTLSLIVSPEEVQLVTQASEMGAIRIAIRSPTDNAIVSTTPTDLNEVIKNQMNSSAVEKPSAKPDNSLLEMLNKMTPAEPQPVATAEPAPMPQFKLPDFVMRVWKGESAEDIEFIDNKPVNGPSSAPSSFPTETFAPSEPAEPAASGNDSTARSQPARKPRQG